MPFRARTCGFGSVNGESAHRRGAASSPARFPARLKGGSPTRAREAAELGKARSGETSVQRKKREVPVLVEPDYALGRETVKRAQATQRTHAGPAMMPARSGTPVQCQETPSRTALVRPVMGALRRVRSRP